MAVRHALQEAARRSEGSFRGRTDVAHSLGPEDSSLSANDSVRDGMTFRQARRSGAVGAAGAVVGRGQPVAPLHAAAL